MALPNDLSLMDFILERDDPLLGLTEKDLNGRVEYNDSEMNSENWPSNPDDLFDSMLKLDDQSFDMLNDDLLPEISAANSTSSSDSGMSSDQQMSPRFIEPDEDDTNILTSDYNINQVENEIEIESSVLSGSDIDNLQCEDDHRVINLVSVPDEPQVMTVLSHSQSKLISPNTTVLRVTPISGNPRSLLLPVNVKNVRDIKTIKVINLSRTTKVESEVSTSNNVTVMKTEIPQEELHCAGIKSQYPRLQLTNEEKRLLQKEGVRLPTHYPLTKHEERELKRIRRKIRNKRSAQDSRKRKKEYIDGLEERVKQCSEENAQLVKRIKSLQTQNQSLTAQLQRLQALISRSTTKSVQPATCLMVLLLSMALVMAPNLRPGTKPDLSDLTEMTEQTFETDTSSAVPVPSRTLLFSKTAIVDEPGKEELEIMKHPHSNDHDYGHGSKFTRINYERTMSENSNPLESVDSDAIGMDVIDHSYTQEMRVNISDKGGTHTVTLKVPTGK